MAHRITDANGNVIKVAGNFKEPDINTVIANFQKQIDNLESKLSKRYLVNSYNDGTTWYNIYSDGWKECGGIISNQGFITTTMPVTFSNTNYTLLSGTTTSVEESREMIVVKFKNKTTSTFRSALSYLYNDGGYGYSSSAYSWYACGY